jgi:hypothetical protein
MTWFFFYLSQRTLGWVNWLQQGTIFPLLFGKSHNTTIRILKVVFFLPPSTCLSVLFYYRMWFHCYLLFVSSVFIARVLFDKALLFCDLMDVTLQMDFFLLWSCLFDVCNPPKQKNKKAIQVLSPGESTQRIDFRDNLFQKNSVISFLILILFY